MGRPEDSMDSLKQERDQALVDISNAARFLSDARQRELNGWLRELVQKIGKLREKDERGKPGAGQRERLPFLIAALLGRLDRDQPPSGGCPFGLLLLSTECDYLRRCRLQTKPAQPGEAGAQ